MKIVLNKIPRDGLKIDENITFDSTYFENTDILEIKEMRIQGELRKNLDQDFLLELNCKGIMVLPDSRTLDRIDLPFQFEIQEKIDETNENLMEYFEKEKNTLDIMGILWENIVLEVPIRITKEENQIISSGDGWELVDKKEESIDPRLAPLAKLLDNGKE